MFSDFLAVYIHLQLQVDSFGQCIAQIRSNSDLFKFVSCLVWILKFKLLYLFIFNSV
jgi:hypothetical protein